MLNIIKLIKVFVIKLKVEKIIQERIRNYRKERGLTLRQLAEKANCTASYISQVEKRLTVPSLSMVGRLAAALNIKVVDLLVDVQDEDQSDWHLSKANRKVIYYPDGRVSSQLLVTRISTKKIEPMISIIQPGGTSDESERMTHPIGTEEFVLIMKGEIDFNVNGIEIHLRKGDTFYFDGTLPHRWVNNGKKTSEVLFVFTPPI